MNHRKDTTSELWDFCEMEHAVLEMDTWRVKAQAPHPHGSSEALDHNPISTGPKPHYILVQGSTTTCIFIRSLSFRLEYIQEKIENDQDWDFRDFLRLLRISYGRISTMPLTKNENIFCMSNLSKNWWNTKGLFGSCFQKLFFVLENKKIQKTCLGKGVCFCFLCFLWKTPKLFWKKLPKSNCL